jgi:hypothetical protein
MNAPASIKGERSATWHRTPDAQALLAIIAASPPSRSWQHIMDTAEGAPVFGWKYDRRDPRVRKLARLHSAACDRAMADYDAGRISREQFAAEAFTSADAAIEAWIGAPLEKAA